MMRSDEKEKMRDEVEVEMRWRWDGRSNGNGNGGKECEWKLEQWSARQESGLVLHLTGLQYCPVCALESDLGTSTVWYQSSDAAP